MSSPRILLIGRRQDRVDALVETLRTDGLDITGTADFDTARTLMAAGKVDAVAVGAGIDDAIRLPFARQLRTAFPHVPVHVKPDRTGGPAAMPPFIRGIVDSA